MNFLEKIKDFLYDYLYKPVHCWFCKQRKYKAWKAHLKDDRDWDYAFIYRILAFKLERVHTALVEGVAVHKKKDLNALKKCIRILKRLDADDYDMKHYRAHDKKWGKMKTWFEPVDPDKPDGSQYWRSSRSKVKTKKQREKERAEFLECYKKGGEDREKDFDELFRLMKEHRHSWWD